MSRRRRASPCVPSLEGDACRPFLRKIPGLVHLDGRSALHLFFIQSENCAENGFSFNSISFQSRSVQNKVFNKRTVESLMVEIPVVVWRVCHNDLALNPYQLYQATLHVTKLHP